MPLSKKQRRLLAAPLPRITILQGCISSGKTFVANHKAMGHIAQNYDGQALVFFCGRTLKTLERNVLQPLEAQYRGFFDYSLNQKMARLCGVRIELEGCDDAAAEAKLRGSTAWFIYGDELTLWNKPFLTRCLGSLRVPGACLLGTTNPDSPDHFVKTDFLDRAAELGLWNLQFTMADNPANTRAYVESVAREYTGVYKQRFIEGRWVRAEGAIYQVYSDREAQYLTKAPAYDMVQVGVDFGGNKSAYAFVACGLTGDCGRLTALRSERHAAQGVTPEGMYHLLELFIAQVEEEYGAITAIYADSAEQALINGLRGRLAIPVRNSLKRPVNDRIHAMTALMAQERFCMTGDCESLAAALRNAVWDTRSLHDVRLDDGTSDIDTLDAFEYSWERYLDRLVRWQDERGSAQPGAALERGRYWTGVP